MILVDSSVWIDHLRRTEARLAALLHAGRILVHPFVTGELASGRLRQRAVILATLADLPQGHVATNGEVLHFIERRDLAGSGIGYVDAHLLASVSLTAGATLWTRDRRLQAVANHMGMAFA